MDTDCVSTTNYCGVGGACLVKQGNGLVCAVNSQCTSNICGGRCCPGPAFCSCTQPSSSNLVPNAGFDSGLSPWTVPGTTETVSWVSDDAEGCPYSGSASIVGGALADDDAAEGVSELLSPCIPLSPSANFNFGMRINGYGGCGITLYQGESCTGATSSGGSVPGNSTAWPSNVNVAFSSGNAQSGRISCTVGGSPGTTMHIDMVYVTPAPGSY